jgi:hypothetical protein
MRQIAERKERGLDDFAAIGNGLVAREAANDVDPVRSPVQVFV